MLTIVNLYLYRTNGTLRSVKICHIVQRLVLPENLFQLLQRTITQPFSEFRILRHGLHLVALQHRFYVKSRSATKDGTPLARKNVVVSHMEILLKAEQVILLASLTDVNQMVRYALVILPVPTSMPRYTWRLSALMTSASPKCAARRVASVVFPEAVGPRMVMSLWFMSA